MQKLTSSTTESSAAATTCKPSAFAEVLTPNVPEFCVVDIKRESNKVQKS